MQTSTETHGYSTDEQAYYDAVAARVRYERTNTAATIDKRKWQKLINEETEAMFKSASGLPAKAQYARLREIKKQSEIDNKKN
jgi:hypothetical protein